ncbi:MAG: hypothetical protein R2795_25705 [Saprospiraceae bacterium]
MPLHHKGKIATPISESEFKKRFPKCYAYFLSEKIYSRDKGKVKFEPFFIWGRRTQEVGKNRKENFKSDF